MADLVAQPRKRMLMLLCCLGLCGALQLFLAFSIPYFTIGLLGLLVLCGSIGLAREILLRRTRYLLWVGFFQPIPLIMLVYVDYVNLAEALDADSYHVATEDDLESGGFWFDRKKRSSHFFPWTMESEKNRRKLMEKLEEWTAN